MRFAARLHFFSDFFRFLAVFTFCFLTFLKVVFSFLDGFDPGDEGDETGRSDESLILEENEEDEGGLVIEEAEENEVPARNPAAAKSSATPIHSTPTSSGVSKSSLRIRMLLVGFYVFFAFEHARFLYFT